VNTNNTAIRNFSIRVEKKTPDGRFLIELLGDEGLSTEDVDLSIGEFYYESIKDLKYLESTVRMGLFKLDYGVLNDFDDHFYRLPSYYKFLYGLPRGIDTGLFVNNQILESKFHFAFGAYLGKALRATDLKRRESFGTPFSAHLKYEINKTSNIKIDYFIREYEGSPRVRGLGLSYEGGYKYKALSFSVLSEVFLLNTNSTEVNSQARTFLLSPKVGYKKIYLQPIISGENWENQSATVSSSESFNSIRAGFHLTDHLILEGEYLKIEDKRTALLKEEQLIARVYLNWSF